MLSARLPLNYSPLKILAVAALSLLLTACQASLFPNDQSEEAIAAAQSANSKTEKYLIADNGYICLPYAANSHPDDPVLPPKPPEDLWQRVRDGFQLDVNVDSKRVQSELNWYRRHPAYMKRVSIRAQRYMYHIVEELESREMPLELALLPIVESAFDPFAYSHGRAAGMWQFIPGTARMYGLDKNWWYDGRRDITASTDAALKYLSRLNKLFDGDWLHALASYNSGQGKVGRAIRKNKKQGKNTAFWDLKLPRETEAYVPKLIALAMLVADPEKYNITLPMIENQPYFSIVDVGSQIDLAQAATMADISMEELYRLNPGFNRWATAPKGPHHLLVPVAKERTFQLALDNLPPDQRIGWERYHIRNGDSLITIANKYNTRPDVIKRINGIKGNTIRAGKTLLVPIAQAPMDDYVLSIDQRLARMQTRAPSSKKSQQVKYTVRKGDSFWKISRNYNVGTKELARWNGMAPGDPLRPGKKLTIWMKNPSKNQLASASPLERQAMYRKIGYRVRSGDSLARIAGKFNVRINDIVKWNALDAGDYLQPGQSLKLYVDIMNTM